MSDKSFGDHTTRNIVKNPLLSTAVTGLSIEDLTHKAVLLPVNSSLGQITRSEQQSGSQHGTLGHSDNDTPTFPSGDSNIMPSNTSQNINQDNILASQNNVKLDKNPGIPSATQSKASLKSDDDFDVNEYIARLQGTRYVSAPLHSHLKDDQNANMDTTEENLEEINLNDSQGPQEVQQSITADIAQNFSQLPAVLPHVASAVFSSFSNMLNYKREQAPAPANVTDVGKGYDEVQFQRPDVGVSMGIGDSALKEVAPPPKEPPIGGTAANFRLTTKKKYAQIPGLSSGESSNQTMTFSTPSQNMPFGHNMPPVGHNLPPTGHNMPPVGHNLPPTGQQPPMSLNITMDQNVPLGQDLFYNNPPVVASENQDIPSCSFNVAPHRQSIPPFITNIASIGQQEPIDQDVSTIFNPNETNMSNVLKPAESGIVGSLDLNVNTQYTVVSQPQYNMCNPSVAETKIIDTTKGSQNVNGTIKDTQNYFTPIEHKEQNQNIPNVPGSVPIIPPPPMFSNLSKKDGQSVVTVKSILPPSVARRISANQPTKPTVPAPFLQNIFVPAPISDAEDRVDNAVTTGLSSAFVPACGSPIKYDPIKPPSSADSLQSLSHTNVPPNVPQVFQTIPAKTVTSENQSSVSEAFVTPPFFIPSETSQSGVTTYFTPQAVPSTAADSSIPTLPPTYSLPHQPANINVPYGSDTLPTTSSNGGSAALASSIFTPSTDVQGQSATPLIFQPTSHNVPTPTSFYNPLQYKDSLPKEAPHPITQMPPLSNPEPPKVVAEPPKAAGNINFRMTKKRPQYYAGPIEGVGYISNNVKPVIAPVMPAPAEASNFHETLFTPEQSGQPTEEQYTASNIEQASIPYDISRPVEAVHTPFEISTPLATSSSPYTLSQPCNYGQEGNTTFDMSRATTDSFDPPKQETRSFGLIGSLKSKLSSIDINKIQSTVTTFFDPAYNNTKVDEQASQSNAPYRQYSQQQNDPTPQAQSSFDIYVPNVEQNQYSQYQQNYHYNTNQYFQKEDPYIQRQNAYDTSNYFSNPAYSTGQEYPSNPAYDATQAVDTSNTQKNIPETVETLSVETPMSVNSATFYNPNAFPQNSMKLKEQSFHITSQQSADTGNATSEQETSLQNVPYNLGANNIHKGSTQTSTAIPQSIHFEQATPSQASTTSGESISFYNPNAFMPENKATSLTFDLSASISKIPESTASAIVKSQDPTFYNPSVFATGENQDFPITQQLDICGSGSNLLPYATAEHENFSISQHVVGSGNIQDEKIQDISAICKSTASDALVNSHHTGDSALNTVKYNMSNIQSQELQQNFQPRPLQTSAASYFNNPQNIASSFLKTTEEGKILPDNLSNFDTKDVTQLDNVEFNKKSENTLPPIGTKPRNDVAQITENKAEKIAKENTLIESLSKDEIPILGVSTVPLFGLSAMIVDKSKEMSELGQAVENVSLVNNPSPRNLVDGNSSSSFFESMPENKSSGKHTSLDITGLSITDVKNVLLIEPPQDNIGAVLKRNVSSSLLENVPQKEEHTSEHFRQQNENLASTAFQEVFRKKFDEQASQVFFQHASEDIIDNEQEAPSHDIRNDEDTELNICETCREVNTPDFPETDDVTMQMIENITSPMLLSNPLTVPLSESNVPTIDRSQFDSQQLSEIAHIAEDTIETLQVQAATELLDDQGPTEARNYGWATENLATMPTHIDHDYIFNTRTDTGLPKDIDYGYAIEPGQTTADEDYEFKLDPNAIGFFGNNSLFFENLPTNASDEIKAEIKNSHEDIVLPRQMSIPSAPPAEEDSKSDETGGLDVHSIEQDAKKDFPLEEEFIIEPSETDDDKIEFRERKRSSEDTTNDTFTNRVERFKKASDHPNEDEQKGSQVFGSPPMSMASYFDTGNYAVESHYRNSLTSPTSINTFQYSSNVMRIPPGFEEEYARRLSGISLSSGENRYMPDANTQMFMNTTVLNPQDGLSFSGFGNEPFIPDTNTQTKPTVSTTLAYSPNFGHHQKEPFIPDTQTQTKVTSSSTYSTPEHAVFGDNQNNKYVPNASIQTKPNISTTYTTPPEVSRLEEHLNEPYIPDTTTQTKLTSSLIYSRLEEHLNEPFIPDTTTQTKPTSSLIYSRLEEHLNEPFIPDTTTQTKPTSSLIYSSSHEAAGSEIGFATRQENIAHTNVFSDKVAINPTNIFAATDMAISSPQRCNVFADTLVAENNKDVRTVPDTTTQTKPISSTTYSSPQDNQKYENVPATDKTDTNIFGQTREMQSNVEPVQKFKARATAATVETQVGSIPETVKLPDPVNFFSTQGQSPEPETAPESFNRLASYFSMPPSQPDHSKSFFELSQSQNHYRHVATTQITVQSQNVSLGNIDDVTKQNITNLMKDLTSPINIQEEAVTTVNFFSVKYDIDNRNSSKAAPIKLPTNEFEIESIVDKTNAKVTTTKSPIDDSEIDPKLNNIKVKKVKKYDDFVNCEYCVRQLPGLDKINVKFRKAANDPNEPESSQPHEMNNDKESSAGLTMNYDNFDVEGQKQDNVTVINENRMGTEYAPVKYHWFYRVDVEEKSVWRGFSLTDSRALEDAYRSPSLNENTVVATDGGRFDVNIMGRLRIAVYWREKPTNVRRCSWFYKGTTDARYVPYTEAVAEKLEEEYRHGITTGEWHRKLSLPNSEMVIMHGPSVMVHFLQSGTTDAFSTPPNLLGKRVYRNPPKIRVARDQSKEIDHLILLVHGAGEYKKFPYIDQATSRPRVVRRGTEESEIEESEPSKIDHLLLLCHGVGSACDMRFRSVEEVVEDFRTTSLQLLQSHYRNSYDNGIVSRVEVLPVSWHDELHAGETGVDRRLSRVTLESIPRLRAFTNHTVLDVLFYTSSVFHQTIISTVCSELNRIYSMFIQRNPQFKGNVSLGGHSLGSVILYDLLCHQIPPEPAMNPVPSSVKSFVRETLNHSPATENYPQLVFSPAALYALGSPIAIFECIRGVDMLGMNFSLPTCKNFFNIFHPYDPIAYRMEPLINPVLQEMKPSQIPHHKGRKRMHLELKDTMARVGADLKQKLVESIRVTWNRWKSAPPNNGTLEKVVEEELEKDPLCDTKDDQASEMNVTPDMLGNLNSGRRIDYVLQETPFEMINEYLFAISSHVGYWESEDTMLLMLREIYTSLGVEADSTVPQQSMTVERTLSQSESNVIKEREFPSTSGGST